MESIYINKRKVLVSPSFDADNIEQSSAVVTAKGTAQPPYKVTEGVFVHETKLEQCDKPVEGGGEARRSCSFLFSLHDS